MKLLSTLMVLAFLGNASNAYSTEDVLIHEAVPDNVVRSGEMHIKSRNLSDTEFEVRLKYNIKVRVFIFSKTFDGESVEVLPIKFKYLYGYEELEQEKRMIYKKIELTHVRRLNLENYRDCHLIHLRPLSHSKWEGNLTYCPDIPSVGFARTALTYKKVPILGEHTMNTRYVDRH